MGLILLAEDDDSTRAFLRLYLERMSHNVIEAIDGARALAALRTASVDLVVTDLDMPGMNGVDLIEAMRGGQQKDVPIIALSGHMHMIEKAHRAGADHALTKPVKYKHLEPMVRALIGQG